MKHRILIGALVLVAILGGSIYVFGYRGTQTASFNDNATVVLPCTSGTGKAKIVSARYGTGKSARWGGKNVTDTVRTKLEAGALVVSPGALGLQPSGNNDIGSLKIVFRCS